MGRKNKKGRSQKDASLDDDENTFEGEIDRLSEDHTIAESITSLADDFEADTDAEEIEDLIITGSAGDNSQAAASNRHARCIDSLNTVEDLITEKRSARREAGLRRLFRAVTHFGSTNTISPYQPEVLSLCIQSIRGGKPAEQYAACRLLEAWAVVLGADHDDFFESIETPLRRALGMAIRAPLVRIAALRAFTLSNFICASDDMSTESLLDLCEEVAAKEYRNHAVPALLRAAALECWALLSTTIDDFYISGSNDDHNGRGLILLPLIQECLEGEASLELRSAAGECLAIIHEARVNLGDIDGENGTERRYGQGGWENSEWEETMDCLQQNIVHISNQSGHSISKKAKKEQRAIFREYVSTIVDGEFPQQSVSFRGGTLTLTSWKEVVQLNFIRHCLQGGLQTQILTNPTLQSIFSADGNVLNSDGHLSQLEKRLFLSKTSEASKQAYVDRNKKRQTRNNIKNHFLTTDGEDI